ncbi:MAG: hypothetical protein R2744_10630 [Bacteroidales bacterium]
MDNYSVRDYTPGDYKEVVRIWNETAMGGPERGGHNEAIIDHSISIGGRLLLLVDQNNKRVIGTSWMTF